MVMVVKHNQIDFICNALLIAPSTLHERRIGFPAKRSVCYHMPQDGGMTETQDVTDKNRISQLKVSSTLKIEMQ